MAIPVVSFYPGIPVGVDLASRPPAYAWPWQRPANRVAAGFWRRTAWTLVRLFHSLLPERDAVDDGDGNHPAGRTKALECSQGRTGAYQYRVLFGLERQHDGQVGAGTRYDAAMESINGFVDKRPGDAFGMTVFGSQAQHWIPLTTDPSAFRCAVPFLNPRKLPPGYGGGTMIGLGLKKCQEVLVTRETGDRMIILVSDGASFDLGDGAEEVIGKSLRDDNIVVYSIHIGEGITPPEVSTITNIANGRSFNPQDVQSLQGVFQRIDKMEVAEMKQTYAEVLDWFTPFSIAGISLAGMGLFSMLLFRYTPW